MAKTKNIQTIGGNTGIGVIAAGKTETEITENVEVGGYDLQGEFFRDQAENVYGTLAAQTYLLTVVEPEADEAAIREAKKHPSGTDDYWDAYEREYQEYCQTKMAEYEEKFAEDWTARVRDQYGEQIMQIVTDRENTPGQLRIGVIAAGLPDSDKLGFSQELINEVLGEGSEGILFVYNDDWWGENEQKVKEILKEILPEDMRARISVSGDIIVEKATVSAGATVMEGDLSVGGKVDISGKDAAGIILSEGASAELNDVNVSVEKYGAGIVAVAGGTANIDSGSVMVNGEEGAKLSGVVLSGGQVTVSDGDIIVDGDKSVGATLLNLGDNMVALVQEAVSETVQQGVEGDRGEAFVKLIDSIIGSKGNTLTVNGTIKAENGLMALDGKAAGQFLKNLVEAVYESGYYENPDRTEEEMLQKIKEAYSTEDASGPDPDITVWHVDVDDKDKVVRKGDLNYNFRDVLASVLGEDAVQRIIASRKVPELEKDMKITLDEEYANKVAEDINYIIRVGKLTDENGTEVGGNDAISVAGTREHQGYDTAKLDEELIIKVSYDTSAYELVNVSGGQYATLTKNADGTYTLKVPARGAVQIDAVLKAIRQMQPEPEKDTPISIPTVPQPQQQQPQ